MCPVRCGAHPRPLPDVAPEHRVDGAADVAPTPAVRRRTRRRAVKGAALWTAPDRSARRDYAGSDGARGQGWDNPRGAPTSHSPGGG